MLGDLESALARAREGQDAAEQSGQPLFARATTSRSRASSRRSAGESSTARRGGAARSSSCPATGGRRAELVATAALGHLELALGSPGRGRRRCSSRSSRSSGGRRSSSLARSAFVVDQSRRSSSSGGATRRVELLDWYEGNARRLERASALANCARCRGLLAAQAGDLDDALAAYRGGARVARAGRAPARSRPHAARARCARSDG